jgi:hypothetical protein
LVVWKIITTIRLEGCQLTIEFGGKKLDRKGIKHGDNRTWWRQLHSKSGNRAWISKMMIEVGNQTWWLTIELEYVNRIVSFKSRLKAENQNESN